MAKKVIRALREDEWKGLKGAYTEAVAAFVRPGLRYRGTMKAEVREIKRQFGEIRLFPGSARRSLAPPTWSGRAISSSRRHSGAWRRLRPLRSGLRKVEKRPVKARYQGREVEFHQHTNRLRIAGVIESGVDVKLAPHPQRRTGIRDIGHPSGGDPLTVNG